MLVLVLALVICVALTGVESAAVPESVLRLFGIQEDEAGAVGDSSTCGPQVDIETPACTVVEQRSKYELRKYTDSEVGLNPSLNFFTAVCCKSYVSCRY